MIIGIGGASRSGKTLFAETIISLLPENKAKILSIDDYVLAKDKLPKIRNHIDWEIPDSYDFDLLKQDISKYSQKYPTLIVEGFIIYYDLDILSVFDLKFFIDIPKSTFVERKTKDLRWGAEPAWYIEYIWLSYLKYGRPKHFNSYHLFSGETPPDLKRLQEVLYKSN